MNLTVDLPIYKKTYELTSLLIDYVQEFPKQFKFSIGEKIIDTSLQLFEFISLANKSSEGEARAKYLNQFLLKFEILKTLIRLCSEKKIISIKQTAAIAMLTTSISKQATAWKNYKQPQRQSQ